MIYTIHISQRARKITATIIVTGSLLYAIGFLGIFILGMTK